MLPSCSIATAQNYHLFVQNLEICTNKIKKMSMHSNNIYMLFFACFLNFFVVVVYSIYKRFPPMSINLQRLMSGSNCNLSGPGYFASMSDTLEDTD